MKIHKKTVFNHCEDRILVIPQDLYAMKDVTPLLHGEKSALFHKDLEQDLVDIEFHTKQACIVIITHGEETLTTASGQVLKISDNDALFLPQGINLHSDYFGHHGRLNAFLAFFDEDVVVDFLASKSTPVINDKSAANPFKLLTSPAINDYLANLQTHYRSFNHSPNLIKVKLLELLHLIEHANPEAPLRANLMHARTGEPKRNIVRLMERYGLSNLNAQDLAHLSGRSLSSFNREFKNLYNTTPKQWMIEHKLAYAKTLLTEEQRSVADIATLLGYENISHFIKAFKTKYGVTPKQSLMP